MNKGVDSISRKNSHDTRRRLAPNKYGQVKPDVKRNENQVPVAGQQVSGTGKVCPPFNAEPAKYMVRKHDPADHQEQYAQDYTAVDDDPENP